MGWVDSAPYSCAASDTARDIAVNSNEAKIWHFTKAQIRTLGRNGNRMGQHDKLHYVLEVYVDAVISCIVPTTKRQVKHVAQGILHGIHDVFPASEDDAKTPSQQKATQRGRHIRNNKMHVGF
jgi:hypothetical protein